MHDAKGPSSVVLPFLRERSKIIEIVAARDIVFALAKSVVCAAFSQGSNSNWYQSFFIILYLNMMCSSVCDKKK